MHNNSTTTVFIFYVSVVFVLAFICFVYADVDSPVTYLHPNTDTNFTSPPNTSIPTVHINPEPPLAHLMQTLFSYIFAIPSLSLSFAIGCFRVFTFVISPFTALMRIILSTLVMPPYNLFVGITNFFYPVYMYCLAAACVGAIVGGFAGILSEVLTAAVTAPKLADLDLDLLDDEDERPRKVKPVVDRNRLENYERKERNQRRGYSNGHARMDSGEEDMYRQSMKNRWTEHPATGRRQQPKGKARAF
ncbi:hypothetical protein BC938DRAFT_480750 [Jimgerdemannia flammicorona]|uniref:Uncharacterized protein n=1 Tax=Jimgerdemannia flammicorona TaxID=994334 RepID=A0A433QHT5_9FUNG|nr:hypothetical protein BC938DRAFT_480750 [Jimgerdemannia flammicorona]